MDNQKNEKLEFLKREEVHTMGKDIRRLREGQAQEEQERVLNIQGEENPTPSTEDRVRQEIEHVSDLQKERMALLARVAEQTKNQETLTPRVSLQKPPSRAQKVLVRFVIFLIGSVIITLLTLALV
ncbi:MAG: hypothetical protein Q8P70_02000 [bacterium]|nr:hypothetical protein [bacterium]